LIEDAAARYSHPQRSGDRNDRRARGYDWMDEPARRGDAGDCVTEKRFDPVALVDAMAPLLGFVLAPESRAEAARQLSVAADRAAFLLTTEFDDEDEPAPVFRA
jgi:hypothetical protein